jgi:hypothetical protein
MIIILALKSMDIIYDIIMNDITMREKIGDEKLTARVMPVSDNHLLI